MVFGQKVRCSFFIGFKRHRIWILNLKYHLFDAISARAAYKVCRRPHAGRFGWLRWPALSARSCGIVARLQMNVPPKVWCELSEGRPNTIISFSLLGRALIKSSSFLFQLSSTCVRNHESRCLFWNCKWKTTLTSHCLHQSWLHCILTIFASSSSSLLWKHWRNRLI